jgi:hypothetical protein
MNHARHNGRGKDKTFDFASPDGRTKKRSAFHRYMPADADGASTGKTAATEGGDDCFEMSDFRARWWPAPDIND